MSGISGGGGCLNTCCPLLYPKNDRCCGGAEVGVSTCGSFFTSLNVSAIMSAPSTDRLVLFVLVSVVAGALGAVSKGAKCEVCEGGGRAIAPVVARWERM